MPKHFIRPYSFPKKYNAKLKLEESYPKHLHTKKIACKMLVKLTLIANNTNILRAACNYDFLTPKNYCKFIKVKKNAFSLKSHL